MKLRCVLAAAAIAVVACVPSAKAQDRAAKSNGSDPDKRHNVIKVDFLPFAAIGCYGFAYERTIGEKTSAQLYFDTWSKSIDVGDASAKVSGFSIMPEVRYYVSKKGSPRGFYFGLYVPYRTLKFEGTMTQDVNLSTYSGKASGTVSSKFSFVGLGIDMGPQWLIGNRVSLELNLGVAAGSGKLEDSKVVLVAPTGETKQTDFSLPFPIAVLPRFGLTLGVAF